jgi:hypothetical protein
MARGHRDLLGLRCRALSSPSTCRFLPALSPLPGHPCWPQPAGTPPRPTAWESQTACPWALACSSRFLPGLTPRLTEMDIPDEPAPWLHHHPSEQRLHGYYGPVRQRAPRLVLNAFGFCLGTLPLATRAFHDRDAVSTLAFSRSVREPQTRLTPPLRRTPPGQETRAPARPIPGDAPEPPVSMSSERVSTPQQRTPTREHPDRALLERLPGPHLTRSKPRLFPGRSPRQSSANAAPGRFDACPRRADAGGPTILHLSHSSAYLRGLLHDSSFSVRASG